MDPKLKRPAEQGKYFIDFDKQLKWGKVKLGF
jgi:hypothetical protein